MEIYYNDITPWDGDIPWVNEERFLEDYLEIFWGSAPGMLLLSQMLLIAKDGYDAAMDAELYGKPRHSEENFSRPCCKITRAGEERLSSMIAKMEADNGIPSSNVCWGVLAAAKMLFQQSFNKTQYDFRVSASHFTHNGIRWGNDFLAEMKPRKKELLDEILQKSPGKTGIFSTMGKYLPLVGTTEFGIINDYSEFKMENQDRYFMEMYMKYGILVVVPRGTTNLSPVVVDVVILPRMVKNGILPTLTTSGENFPLHPVTCYSKERIIEVTGDPVIQGLGNITHHSTYKGRGDEHVEETPADKLWETGRKIQYSNGALSQYASFESNPEGGLSCYLP